MPNIQIRNIVDPGRRALDRAVPLPAAANLFDLDPEQIPADAERIAAMDGNGSCVGTISVDRLRRALRTLRQIKLEPLLDELSEAVIAVDRDGFIFYVNPAYTQILGVPAGRILGKNMHRVETDAALLEVLQTGEPIIREKQLIRTMNRYVSVRMFPLKQQGAIIGAASIFRDVTEENRLNQELERTTRMAEEYNRQIEAQAVLKQNNIIGESREFVASVMRANTVAGTNATVLLRGENGVGKEVFTRLIHQNSQRKNKPFIAMNCAAVPESLIESELFGYEEGSFTGARRGGQMGKFQLAEGGTLFLDEIGDMPMAMQAKLLRVLQEGEIEKIGRQRPIAIDVRVIAATNQPLEQLIAEGKFREDLFYRLNVVPIVIPPLRERGNDVVLLAAYYLEKYNQKYQKQLRLSEEVYRLFRRFSWPGNVRQLQNVVESCVVLCDRGVVTADDLPDYFHNAPGPSAVAEGPAENSVPIPERLDEAVAACERAVITAALKKAGRDRQKAAALLGISRRTFYRKVEELQIPLNEA